MTLVIVAAVFLMTSALTGGVQVRAHEAGTTRISVTFHDDRRYEIEVVTDAAALFEKLERVAGRQTGITQAQAYPGGFADRLAALDQVFRPRLIVAFDGVGDHPAIEYAVSPPTGVSAPVATIRLTGTIPRTARAFAWAYFWTFTTYELSVQTGKTSDPVVEWLESGQTSTPFSLARLAPPPSRLTDAWRSRREFMSRWHGYVVPVVVIALSSFVTWCAWPHSRLSAGATNTADAEPRAMHHVNAGDLLLAKGKIEDAAVEYHRANHASPNHLRARLGLARVAVARGHYTRAVELYRALLDEVPTAEIATAIGDILAHGGDARGAAQMYARAEALTRK